MGAQGHRAFGHQRHRCRCQDSPHARRARGDCFVANTPFQGRLGIVLQGQARQASHALLGHCRMVWRPHADVGNPHSSCSPSISPANRRQATRKVLHHVPLPRISILARVNPHQVGRSLRDARLRHGLHERRARHGAHGVGLHQIARDGPPHGRLRR